MSEKSDDNTSTTPQVPVPSAPSSTTPALPSSDSPTMPESHVTSKEEAERFGRVSEDGHVFVKVGENEYAVGQYPGQDSDEALMYFVKKYDDLVNQVALLEARLSSHQVPSGLQKTLEKITLQITEHRVVGNLELLAARVEVLRQKASEASAEEKSRQAERLTASLAEREAVVGRAEQLAAQDPQKIQWKNSSSELAELFNQWQRLQKEGPRQSKTVEDGLWKRFRGARTTFEKHRRAHFSQLDAEHSKAKAAKEKLISRAEELSSSTNWSATSTAYRQLMDEWKKIKRASRKDDDALWARFRAAQDVFFNARQAENDKIDESYRANLKVKEEILVRAQAILPVKNLGQAKRAFASIRDEWESAGKVPRQDMGRMDSALRKVEDAIRQAERQEWDRTNPETQARQDSVLSQLEQSLVKLQKNVDQAKESGDAQKIAAAEEELEAKQRLAQMFRAAQG